jgi:hypothetical protein
MEFYDIDNGSGIFIQIGAGAGDMDNSGRDGFTEFIKKLPKHRIKQIILVEPNPLNIPKLKECWKDYLDYCKIYEIGIVPSDYNGNSIELYYCPQDGPNYQVASIDKKHIQKHYGDNCEINSFIISVKSLNFFIEELNITDEIELLALDIEGIDAEIILELDFNKIKLKYLSFEYIHLGKNEKNVYYYLTNNSYIYLGKGIDHNGFDYLYVNNKLITYDIVKIDEKKIIFQKNIPILHSEKNMIQWVEQLCLNDKIFLDIGANNGLYTLLLANKFNKVYSFESNKKLYYALCGGIALSNLDNVTCLNLKSFDSVINKLFDNIGLIKIDIDIVDPILILQGAINALKLSKYPKILLKSKNSNLDQLLIDFIKKLKYKIIKITGYDHIYLLERSQGVIHPITFSIPEEKIVKATIVELISQKTKIVSNLIPGDLSTYIYNTEEEYYAEYQKSYFAITMKKAGWDCMRHYEILANGCIPYFIDIEKCPIDTMALWPKDLLIQANLLYEKFIKIDNSKIDNSKISEYTNLLQIMLDYLKEYLTTKSIAKYILKKTNFEHISKILYLSENVLPDYLRCLTLHGFKQLFGSNCHDYPKIPHIYKNFNCHHLYGKGITYSRLLDENLHNEDLDKTIEENIKNKYYDIIIYGSYHRGMPFYSLVNKIYENTEIILLCGEDIHDCSYSLYHPLFIRENF